MRERNDSHTHYCRDYTTATVLLPAATARPFIMSAVEHTGYGLKDGRLQFIRDVNSGLDCGCVCASCGKRLIAKKGPVRQHHFAHHEVTNCQGAAESALHILAKELLAELTTFEIPPYIFEKKRKTRTGKLITYQVTVAKGGEVAIDCVRVERRDDGFIPDIVIESRGRALIVEVAVTHKVARAKSRKLRRRNLPAVEIRLDPSDSFRPPEELRAKLQAASACKVWLFHPDQREAERQFLALVRDELRQSRKRRGDPISFQPDRPVFRPTNRCHVAADVNWMECDRVNEAFKRKHGRYPTLEECKRNWPHLYNPKR